MIWDYKKLLIVAVIIVLFGVFVYPTLYKYDKLDQRYPVKINRITGKTQVLSQTGWSVLGEKEPEDPKKTEATHVLDKYRESEIEFERMDYKSEILDITSKEVIVGGLSISRFHATDYYVTGEVMNNSDDVMLLASLNIELFDKDGNVLADQPRVITLSLRTGDSKIFTEYTGAISRDVGKYRVSLSYTKEIKK